MSFFSYLIKLPQYGIYLLDYTNYIFMFNHICQDPEEAFFELKIKERQMNKWHKEPLFHFLIIGALIFVVFSMLNKNEPTVSGKMIVVTAADIEQLSNNWSKRWNRPPTETELKGLVDAYIKEEVYYREALALGLDKNDTILRRRLMQKMQFLTNDLAELSTPDKSELSKYLLDNHEKYQLPAQVSFSHIYFSLQKRGAKTFEDAKNVLYQLNDLSSPDMGDSFMLSYDFARKTSFEVERLFGAGFAEQLFSLDTNAWQGPIASGYGFHLVRITEKTDPRMPELLSVIDKVRSDLMLERRQKMNKEIYEKFKEQYEIVIEDMPIQSNMAKAIRPSKGLS